MGVALVISLLRAMRRDLQIVLVYEQRREAVVVEEEVAFVVDAHRLVVFRREHFADCFPGSLGKLMLDW